MAIRTSDGEYLPTPREIREVCEEIRNNRKGKGASKIHGMKIRNPESEGYEFPMYVSSDIQGHRVYERVN